MTEPLEWPIHHFHLADPASVPATWSGYPNPLGRAGLRTLEWRVGPEEDEGGNGWAREGGKKGKKNKRKSNVRRKRIVL